MNIDIARKREKAFINLRCPLCGAVKKLLKALDIYPTTSERKSIIVHLWDCVCPDCEEKRSRTA